MLCLGSECKDSSHFSNHKIRSSKSVLKIIRFSHFKSQISTSTRYVSHPAFGWVKGKTGLLKTLRSDVGYSVSSNVYSGVIIIIILFNVVKLLGFRAPHDF